MMKLPVTRTPIQTRYSDTDAMGHFSSGSYITFMEIGRLDFFRKLVEQTGTSPSTVVANITVDILHESRYGEQLEVGEFVTVKITGSDEHDLHAEVVRE